MYSPFFKLFQNKIYGGDGEDEDRGVGGSGSSGGGGSGGVRCGGHDFVVGGESVFEGPLVRSRKA